MAEIRPARQVTAWMCFGLAALLAATGCVGPAEVPRFVDDTKKAGLFYRGSGKCVAFGDINGDGKLDIYASVVYDEDRLFVNNGDGTFTSTTGKNAVPLLKPRHKGDGHGAVFVDLDNDGRTDLFVACNPEGGSKASDNVNRLYLAPDLKDVAEAAGIRGDFIRPAALPKADKANRSCGVAVGDIDNDGDLDLYLARGAYEHGHPNALYENRGRPGKPKFVNITARAGVADLGSGKRGGGYVCTFADFDGDGFLDLFIGNLDLSNKGVGLRLFRNNGDGTFTDVSKESGITGPGMCVACAVGDVDNDGDLDLFVVFGDAKRPSALYINDGNFRFRETAAKAGIADKLSSRGACMADLNHDGYLDILVAEFHGGKVYINQGDATFRECAQETGIRNPGMHGCTFADVDGDGDLDLYTTNWWMRQFKESGRFLFFRNQRNDKNWLKVRVKGTTSNRSAVGARLSVYDAGHADDKAHLRGFREVTSGSGVFSSPPLEQHFGLDARSKYDLVVYFPMTKRKVVLRGIATAQTIEVTEPKK